MSAGAELADQHDKALAVVYREMKAARERIAGLERRNAELEKRIATLFDAIKHGDEGHQAWLLDAIQMHFTVDG